MGQGRSPRQHGDEADCGKEDLRSGTQFLFPKLTDQIKSPEDKRIKLVGLSAHGREIKNKSPTPNTSNVVNTNEPSAIQQGLAESLNSRLV